MEEFDNRLENLKMLLSSQSRQSWLFGAGISFGSNIPLMYPLTTRVEGVIQENASTINNELLNALKADLSDDCHIEHILSHLGDLLAIGNRSKDKIAFINTVGYSVENLNKLYIEIIKEIGNIVRYGYVAANASSGTEEEIGTEINSIVKIEPHYDFFEALFKNRSNLERRSKTTFFTTNYDTLLEDALGLHKKLYATVFRAVR